MQAYAKDIQGLGKLGLVPWKLGDSAEERSPDQRKTTLGVVSSGGVDMILAAGPMMVSR